jgi:hypothetical protein
MQTVLLQTAVRSRSCMCFIYVWNKGALLSRLPTRPTFHVCPNADAIYHTQPLHNHMVYMLQHDELSINRTSANSQSPCPPAT